MVFLACLGIQFKEFLPGFFLKLGLGHDPVTADPVQQDAFLEIDQLARWLVEGNPVLMGHLVERALGDAQETGGFLQVQNLLCGVAEVLQGADPRLKVRDFTVALMDGLAFLVFVNF